MAIAAVAALKNSSARAPLVVTWPRESPVKASTKPLIAPTRSASAPADVASAGGSSTSGAFTFVRSEHAIPATASRTSDRFKADCVTRTTHRRAAWQRGPISGSYREGEGMEYRSEAEVDPQQPVSRRRWSWVIRITVAETDRCIHLRIDARIRREEPQISPGDRYTRWLSTQPARCRRVKRIAQRDLPLPHERAVREVAVKRAAKGGRVVPHRARLICQWRQWIVVRPTRAERRCTAVQLSQIREQIAAAIIELRSNPNVAAEEREAARRRELPRRKRLADVH